MNAGAGLMILVAGPYRSGTGDDPDRMAANVRAMEAFALPLFRAGHIPVIGEWFALPLVARAGSRRVGDGPFEEIFHPIAERLLARCDAVLRVGGPSQGADLMVRVASGRGLRVFHHLREVPGCGSASGPLDPGGEETVRASVSSFTPAAVKPPISVSDLEKLDVRVGTIVSVEEVPKSNKLLRLTVDFGDHRRRILAGMKAERPQPREVVGLQALFVINLEPRRMAGEVSEGMLFDIGFADGITPALAVPERVLPNGVRAG